ncbi:hypothetical protein JKF63_04748 [Porcisia hertigi]|uniref:Uncharacterized protein n=1 Tax=Porcisia hertigi TaxID=2761500 RepID=A0A836ITB0_9TRYP|nr:hypothetical protein JKF63_04748 [Porcisia hertigi]
MSASVDGSNHAFRYGAPAVVVDSLLSFLFDLRRMEDSVLSTLECLGVERHALPRPFREGLSAAPLQAPAAVGDAEAAVPGAPSLQMPLSDPLVIYTHQVAANRSDASDMRVGDVVHQLLNWLDSQCSSSRTSPGASLPLLTLLATASSEGADVFLRDAVTREEVHVGRAVKKVKTDTSALPTQLDADGAVLGEDSTVRLIGTLTTADIHAAVQEWRGYESLLKKGEAEMKATLKAVTAVQLGKSYHCHAKWVEKTQGDAEETSVVPASTVLKKNYEKMICLSDALATCQAAVHTAYVALQDHLDIFLEEAQSVDRQIRLFHRSVSVAQSECAALRALRDRIRQARRALEQCIYGQRGTRPG